MEEKQTINTKYAKKESQRKNKWHWCWTEKKKELKDKLTETNYATENYSI